MLDTAGAEKAAQFAEDEVERPVEDEAVEWCSICLDSIDSPVRLPCACKVTFCPQCYDHALATKLRKRQLPVCPTCRVKIQVDVDVHIPGVDNHPVDGKAGFDWKLSLLEEEEAELLGFRMYRDTTKTLQEKLRPLQEYYIRQFQVEKGMLADRSASTSQDGAQNDFSEKNHAPACVCGKKLELMPVETRYNQFLQKYGGPCPSSIYETCIRVQNRHIAVTCDILHDSSLMADENSGNEDGVYFIPCSPDQCKNGVLWTCSETAENTVLHVNNWDVCELCCPPTAEQKDACLRALADHRVDDSFREEDSQAPEGPQLNREESQVLEGAQSIGQEEELQRSEEAQSNQE